MQNNTALIGHTVNYDSDVCSNIPLGFMNFVQPQGALIVFTCDDSKKIIQASQNAIDIVGSAYLDIIGKSLAEFIGQEQLTEVLSKMDRWNIDNHVPLVLKWNNSTSNYYHAILHKSTDYYLLELYPQENSYEQDANHLYREISFIITAIKEAHSIENLCQVAAHELRLLSGFDRVMVYCFDKQHNGNVLAEDKNTELSPFLNLTFPASDIPKQARQLYLKTPYRLIADVAVQQTKLFPVVNPITNSLTDISTCTLRGVPKVHLEYLKNMGVVTSMSIPILVDNKLWGLIVCHSTTCKTISHQLRYTFEIISNIIAAQLGSRVSEKKLFEESTLKGLMLAFIENLAQAPNFTESINKNSGLLLDILEVEGVTVFVKKKMYSFGSVPEQQKVSKLYTWLRRHIKSSIFSTDSLAEVYPDWKEIIRGIGSGVIAIQLGSDNMLIGFRTEELKTINWGGDPNKKMLYEEDGKNYHPRESFSAWEQLVEATSHNWEDSTLQAANQLRSALLEKLI